MVANERKAGVILVVAVGKGSFDVYHEKLLVGCVEKAERSKAKLVVERIRHAKLFRRRKEEVSFLEQERTSVLTKRGGL